MRPEGGSLNFIASPPQPASDKIGTCYNNMDVESKKVEKQNLNIKINMENKKRFALSKIKGFTLIEMLVVIAVVGILSAAVLASLGPARTKAKDARIISALGQVRAVAETYYDGDYDGLSTTNPPQMSQLAADIAANQGSLVVNVSPAPALAYAAYSALPGGGYYCVDSLGNSKREASAPTGSPTACW